MHQIKISQLGEGLTEVRVVALLKKEGDLVAKDEPLLEVETDKAVMEIENSRGGRLSKWLVAVGDLVPVGEAVALIEPTEVALGDVQSVPTISLDASRSIAPPAVEVSPAPMRNGVISPRERARALQNLKTNPKLPIPSATPVSQGDETVVDSSSQKWELSPRQARLGQLLTESEQFVGEAWLMMPAPWDDLSTIARGLRGLEGLQYRPTPLELISWCVVQAMQQHPKFRLLNRSTQGYELQDDASIGISVALPDDNLALAGVEKASTLGLAEFIRDLRFNAGEVVQNRAKPGRYQCVISYMAGHGVRLSAPRLILPAVSTLFVGAPFDTPMKSPSGDLLWERTSNFVLTFDHRVINGVGAANFLKNILANLQAMKTEQNK